MSLATSSVASSLATPAAISTDRSENGARSTNPQTWVASNHLPIPTFTLRAPSTPFYPHVFPGTHRKVSKRSYRKTNQSPKP